MHTHKAINALSLILPKANMRYIFRTNKKGTLIFARPLITSITTKTTDTLISKFLPFAIRILISAAATIRIWIQQREFKPQRGLTECTSVAYTTQTYHFTSTTKFVCCYPKFHLQRDLMFEYKESRRFLQGGYNKCTLVGPLCCLNCLPWALGKIISGPGISGVPLSGTTSMQICRGKI